MFDAMRIVAPLFSAAEHGEHEGHAVPGIVGLYFYIALLLIVILAVLTQARAGTKDRIFKNWFTQRFEQLYLFITNLCVGIIGPHGRHYVPFIITLWLVIFFSNLISLVMPYAPSMDLGFNLGLALISIGYVQYEGMRANGVFGHFSHFAGPKLGIGLIPITLMIFVIELISEAMKNISLSVRLYGNIFGGHEAANAMNELGKHLIQIGPDQYIGIPFGAFLLPVKLLTCLVQALVFCLLTCVYISLVTHHEEDHAEDHADEHAHAA